MRLSWEETQCVMKVMKAEPSVNKNREAYQAGGNATTPAVTYTGEGKHFPAGEGPLALARRALEGPGQRPLSLTFSRVTFLLVAGKAVRAKFMPWLVFPSRPSP